MLLDNRTRPGHQRGFSRQCSSRRRTQPDPTGTSTGASSDAAAADGTTFIVTAPGELTGDELREIYVFGSAARGTGDAASDLDLAVSGLPPSVFYRMGACQ